MNASDDKESDELQATIETAAAQLGENFDSLLIIATASFGGDNFVRFKASSGSHYASIGAAQEWLESVRENTRIQTRRKSDE